MDNMKTSKIKVLEIEDEHHAAEIQIVENLQRKDLNPVEEGQAFKKYLDNSGTEPEMLAKRIGRKTNYVKRRLNLLGATSDVRNALIKGKIELGHAAVLSRIEDKKLQKEVLQNIQDENVRVCEMDYDIDISMNKDLACSPFDKKECKECAHNGGEQTLLTELDGEADFKGTCFKGSCYNKKCVDWTKTETEKLKKKGINVLSEDKLQNFPKAKRLLMGEETKAIPHLEKKPETFAVVFLKEGDYPVKTVYRLEPAKPKKKDKEAEVTLDLNAQERLNRKLGEFKTNLLREKSVEALKPGTMAKALIVHACIQYGGDEEDPVWKAVGLKEDMDVQEINEGIFSASEEDVEKALKCIADQHIQKLDADDLKDVSTTLEIDIKDFFVLTEEFLNLYTVDQLKALALELGYTTPGAKPKKVIMKALLEQWKKGDVPKALQ